MILVFQASFFLWERFPWPPKYGYVSFLQAFIMLTTMFVIILMTIILMSEY
jgi:hypothetical protein